MFNIFTEYVSNKTAWAGEVTLSIFYLVHIIYSTVLAQLFKYTSGLVQVLSQVHYLNW